MLFCLRCSDVLVTLQERDIAFALRISLPDLLQSKAVFIEKGFIDEHWTILNWDKRQYPSDSSTERTRRYRERMRTSQERHGDGLEENRIEEKREEKQKPKARATRLPDDFLPSESHQAIAEERHLDLSKEFESFQDWFRSAPGQKGLKADWPATLRNWLRRSRNIIPNGNGNKPKLIVRNASTGEIIQPRKAESSDIFDR